VAGRIVSIKNSSNTIGNGTRDLLACSTVPQPTAPPRAPLKKLDAVKVLEAKGKVCSKIANKKKTKRRNSGKLTQIGFTHFNPAHIFLNQEACRVTVLS